MKFIIETNLASSPAWWPVDDDRVVAWAGRTFVSLTYADQAAHDVRVKGFSSEEAARDAARRVPRQACTAIGA